MASNMHLQIDPTSVPTAEPMEWIVRKFDMGRALRPWMPDGFERYARVLHPAYVRVWEEGTAVGEIAVPWSAVSEWSGKPLHSTSSIHDLILRSDGLNWYQREGGGNAPLQGQLERASLSRLLTHLAEETATSDEIWMLIWTGYGGPPDTIGLPVEVSSFLKGTGRQYVLRRGSIAPSLDEPEGAAFENPPTFWWPADRSWFVVCDIDASSTYVGGSDKLVERILSDRSLEVFPAELDDPYEGYFVSTASTANINTQIGFLTRLRHYLHQFRPRFRTAHGPSYAIFRSRKKRFWE